MKKIICLILSLAMMVSLPCVASTNTTSNYNAADVKIDDYVVWADTACLFNIEHKGEKIPVTVTNEYLEYFTKIFSDESLIYNAEQTAAQNESPTYENMPCFYVEDNRDDNIKYTFYFNDSIVVLKKSNEEKVYSFSYKNKNTYSEMQKVIDKCAIAEIEMQNEYSKQQNNSGKNDGVFIYNPTKVFDSQFTVTTDSGVNVNWYWGFFGYSTDENNTDTKFASYISKTELWNKNVTYGLFADKDAGDNVIDFSGTGYTRLSDMGKLEIKESNILGYSNIKMSFNVSENKEIEAIKMEVTATNGVKETYNVDMKTFFSSGSVPEYDAFKFSHKANSVIPKEIEDSTPKFDYLTLWKSSQRKIKAVSYNGIGIKEEKLNTTTIPEEVDTFLNSLEFTYTNKKPDNSTELVRITYGSGSDFKHPLYIYETYIEFDGGAESEYYTFNDPSAKEKVKKIFEAAVNEYETDFMTYSYKDETDLRYKYEFEITLNEEQKNTWIGEVCENDKVRITVHHKKPNQKNRYQITLSGNGKSYTLASNSTDHLIIDKDTPVPYGFEKGGKIVLSWTTGKDYVENYKNGTDLTVSIYSKLDNTKRGINSNYTQNPVGGEIKITKIGEVIDLFDKKSEQIESDKPEQVFADVSKTHWANEQIEKFYYANIVRGIGAGLCAPEDSITYEQMGVLLNRLFGYSYENTAKIPAIRQDVFTAIAKACNLGKSDNYDLFDTFADKDDITEENKPYVASLINENIAQGYNGNLKGNDTLTRAEAITLLYRSLKAVYGITDDDEPEEYKFKITPYINQYISVSADIPSEFSVRENVPMSPEWLVNVTEKERMKGKFLMTFGPDAVNDTHIYMVCKIDNAVYTVESTEIDRIEINSSPYFYIEINAYYNIYKDGTLIVENDKFPLLYEGDMDGVTIGKYSSVYPLTMIIFENTKLNQGKKPEMPNKQPHQIKQEELFKEIEEYEGGKEIRATVIEGYGKGLKADMYNPANGTFSLKINKEKTKAQINGTINAPNEIGTTSKVSIEVGETLEINETQAKVKLNIYCDGVLATENIYATISNLDAKLDETITVTTDDGIWSFTAHIYEIVNESVN